MKIVTYLNEVDGDLKVQAMTEDEYKSNGGLPESWHDFVWQDQGTKEAAIARHDDALDAYMNDANTGNPISDTY